MLKKESEVYTPKYHDAVDFSKKHEELHWIESEVKLQDDVEQWKTGDITDTEKNFVSNVLRLFTQMDFNVGASYVDKLLPFFKNNEVRGMLSSFVAREHIHMRAYALLNDTLGFGEDFYHEFRDYAEMKEKHEFMIEEIGDSDRDMAEYIAKQCLLEGVSLFASFAMLLNFERSGKLKGMADVNLWSMRDESLHANGLAWLYKEFVDEANLTDLQQSIHDCAVEVVRLEDAFIDKAFEIGGPEDFPAEQVKQYVRFVCDYRLQGLGLDPIFGIEQNPIPWIDWSMSGVNHANFFEREVSDYSKNNMTGEYIY